MNKVVSACVRARLWPSTPTRAYPFWGLGQVSKLMKALLGDVVSKGHVWDCNINHLGLNHWHISLAKRSTRVTVSQALLHKLHRRVACGSPHAVVESRPASHYINKPRNGGGSSKNNLKLPKQELDKVVAVGVCVCNVYEVV